MKLIMLSFILLLSTHAFGVVNYSSLEIVKESDGSDANYKAVYLEDRGGSAADPDIVYVPFSRAGQLSAGSSYLGSITGYLPDFNDLKFRFTITTDTTEYYAVAVRQDGSTTSYTIIAAGASTLTAGASTTITFLDNELCSYMGGGTCANLQTDPAGNSENFYIAVLGFSTLKTVGNTITIADHEANGQVISLKMKSAEETNSPTITTTLVGDENLEINFDSPTYANFGDLKKTLIITRAGGGGALDLQTATATLDTTRALGTISTGIDEVDPKTSGAVKIKGLVNEYQYHVSVALVNEYQLATYVSPSISGTPLDIETFLQAQNCYLVSAGFGKQHYVLNYFRSFRDNILLKSEWGTKFVEFYYSSAPEYARYIYEVEWLKALMKISAYMMYSLMNFPIPILLGFLTLFGLRRVIKLPIK